EVPDVPLGRREGEQEQAARRGRQRAEARRDQEVDHHPQGDEGRHQDESLLQPIRRGSRRAGRVRLQPEKESVVLIRGLRSALCAATLSVAAPMFLSAATAGTTTPSAPAPAASAAPAGGGGATPAQPIYIHAGVLIDGTGGAPRKDAGIVVIGGRIASV